MRWSGHKERMEKNRNVYNTDVRKNMGNKSTDKLVGNIRKDIN